MTLPKSNDNPSVTERGFGGRLVWVAAAIYQILNEDKEAEQDEYRVRKISGSP